jgi:hypothetical protein
MGAPMYMGMMYGDMPVQCICPQCRQTIITRIEKKNGVLAWLLCGGITFFGGFCGCCLIPFVLILLK